jgi:hypothetical protein
MFLRLVFVSGCSGQKIAPKQVWFFGLGLKRMYWTMRFLGQYFLTPERLMLVSTVLFWLD